MSQSISSIDIDYTLNGRSKLQAKRNGGCRKMGGSKNGRQGISGDRRKIGGKGSQEMGGKMGGNGEREKRREEN